MASIVDPDPDIKREAHKRRKVRHGYCHCQDAKPIQTAVCGHTEPGSKLVGVAPTTVPDNACVVCLDLAYRPRVCCGLGL